MNEFAITMLILVALFAIFVFGVLCGNTKATNEFSYKMNQVGIEKIVRCNNTQSNWYEIVWIKKQ